MHCINLKEGEIDNKPYEMKKCDNNFNHNYNTSLWLPVGDRYATIRIIQKVIVR